MDIDAMQAGRELDALVAERVMGCHVISGFDWYSHPTAFCACDNHDHEQACSHIVGILAHYSTDISAAWQVVEHVNKMGDWSVWQLGNGNWRACILFDQCIMGDGTGETAPLAICRAALSTVAVDPPDTRRAA